MHSIPAYVNNTFVSCIAQKASTSLAFLALQYLSTNEMCGDTALRALLLLWKLLHFTSRSGLEMAIQRHCLFWKWWGKWRKLVRKKTKLPLSCASEYIALLEFDAVGSEYETGCIDSLLGTIIIMSNTPSTFATYKRVYLIKLWPALVICVNTMLGIKSSICRQMMNVYKLHTTVWRN